MGKTGSINMSYETGLRIEEKVASLFQPDILLPAQYLDTFRRKANLEPERELMLAVLEDAIWCFQNYILARDSKRIGLFRDAEAWIFEENCDWLFSFENICELWGFNPQYVRQGLARWKERKSAERRKARIYRLIPREARKEPSVMTGERTGERLRKAASGH